VTLGQGASGHLVRFILTSALKGAQQKETIVKTASKFAHIYVGADQASDDAAIHRSKVVGNMAVNTPRYQNDPTFKAVINDQVQAGVDLNTAAIDVSLILASLAKVRGVLDAKRQDWRRANGAAIKQVEKTFPTEQEIQSYGYSVLTPSNSGLVAPSDIVVRYDLAKALLRIHVRWSSRGQKCVIEISTDPIGEGTWVQLDGSGCLRALSGYAPGTYWVRAATVRAKAQSEWFGPVAVIVK
jgi:hypothetical protein